MQFSPLKKDFDAYGISLVRTRKHFGVLLKFANKLVFPYLIQCDRDALINIENSVKVGSAKVNTSPVFYDLEVSTSLEESDKEEIASMGKCV